MTPLCEPPPGFTAQLVDPDNTARCATVMIAGFSERRARGAANRMGRSCGLVLADFYPHGTPSSPQTPAETAAGP